MENKKVNVRKADDRDLIRLLCHHDPPNVELPRRLTVEISRKVWGLQDGCEGDAFLDWDWDGIEESSEEAVKAMAGAIREVLLADGIEELETHDKDPFADFA